jgi:hypothetical protein
MSDFEMGKEGRFLRLTETSLSPKQNAKVTEILIESSPPGVVKLLLKLHYGAGNICGPFHHCGAEKRCKYTYLELYNLMMAYMIAKGAMVNNAPDDLTYDEVSTLEKAFHVNWAKTFGPVLTEDLRIVCREWYRVVSVEEDMVPFGTITFNDDGYEYCEIDVDKYFDQLIAKIDSDASLTDKAYRAAISKAILEKKNFKQPD